jgi:hypothetical protein
MDQTNLQALDILIGRELSSVEFVRDYIQLHFDGPSLTMVTNPVIYTADFSYNWDMPGYRDALCDRIGTVVSKAFVVEGEEFRLEFDDSSCVVVSLREDDYVGAEAILLHNGPNELWVW